MIDQSFVHTNKISTFKLKQQIKLELENKETVEWIDKTCLVDVEIGNHKKQLLCYAARLEAYTMVLGDSWLQQHNLIIDCKDCAMRFNSALCMKKKLPTV